MVVQNEINVQAFRPINGVVEEIEKEGIELIIRCPGGHIMQIDRQPDHIATQAFNILKILFCVFGELNPVGISSLKPTGKVYPPAEGHILCTKIPHIEYPQYHCNTNNSHNASYIARIYKKMAHVVQIRQIFGTKKSLMS
jgi:hypothetical protein